MSFKIGDKVSWRLGWKNDNAVMAEGYIKDIYKHVKYVEPFSGESVFEFKYLVRKIDSEEDLYFESTYSLTQVWEPNDLLKEML